jgi:orotate phosphoribosyltransferase-like protein
VFIMIKVSEDLKREFVNLYKKGLGTWKIAKKFNLGLTTVRNHLLKAGVRFRQKKKITGKLVEEFVSLYNKGLSIKQIAKKFNVAFSTVRNHLRSTNVKLRPRGKKKEILPSAHQLTSEKAYVLGVVGPGDGFIEFNKNSKQICLEAIDKDFIDYFAKCLEKIYGIKPSIKLLKMRPTDTHQHFKVRLYSTEACKELLSYGVSFREGNWEVPNEIKKAPSQIRAMYLRGMADSQGSVIYSGQTRFVELCNTNTKGLEEIGELLNSLGVIDWYIYDKGLRIYGRKALTLFAQKINFTIERKTKTLERLLNSYNVWKKTQREINELMPHIISLKESGISVNKISKRLNVDHRAISKRLKLMSTKNSSEQIEFKGT